MSAPAQASTQVAKKPILLRILVWLWAIAVGGSIFDAGNVFVRVATGNWPTNWLSARESMAWAGIKLLVAALLVAACYALHRLRQSAVRLFAIYLALQVVPIGVDMFRNPESAASARSVVDLVVNLGLTVLTLAYAYSLRARAVLV